MPTKTKTARNHLPPRPPKRQRSIEFCVPRDGTVERRTYLLDWIPIEIDDAVRAKLERTNKSLRPLLLTYLREWAHQ